MAQDSSTKAGLPKRRSPRLRHFDYAPAFAYSITICTQDRVPFFRDERTGREVARCLEEHAAQCGYRLVCYCIMAGHIHILTGPSEGKGVMPLPRFIRQFKSAVTHHLGRLWLSGGIWQRSFYDHVLRKDEDAEVVARYILANPVRKGLADTPEAYALSRYYPENLQP